MPRTQDIFDAALDRPPGGERAAFVAEACAGDDALRAQVEALLAAHEEAGEFMRDDLPPAPELARLQPETVGTRIGRYKLLQEIGAGGFGTVWMAEQTEPFSRRVALKIIKPGMDTREVIARFESERQALARMEHANIARVFDAGATPQGRPYFVMELVRGVPITQYCDEAGLGTRERLALFGDVCSAINHAHQKGIIHRDIKPSNVMVTVHGERPVVKVIDFGIAKATEGRLTDQTLFTRFEQFVGTPVYMSPKQASWSGLDVDTRSDIYALGVLLYELLTGTPPFDARTMATAGYEEMRRIIREVEPPRPSARLRTTSGQERGRLARARQTEPIKVSHLVDADLDWIVMKAIDKDRARRYQTANGLAHDIERFLADEPISARAPTAAYQFGKFARRHRGALGVAVGVLAVLVAATLVSAWQAVRAGQSLRQAQAAQRESVAQRTRADAEAERARQNLYYAQMHLAQQAWYEHRGLGEMSALLAHWLPDGGSPDRRGWEWAYLNALPVRNVRTLAPYGRAAVTGAVAWHAASGRLAHGTGDGTIRIWDAGQKHVTQTLHGSPPGIDYWGGKWLAWSPDGHRLAAGGRDGTVSLWEDGPGAQPRVFQTGGMPVFAVAFSADGQRLAAWDTGGTVTVWEVATGSVAARVVHPAAATAGAWSPDDRLLACGHEDGTVTFSEACTGAAVTALQAQSDLIYDVAWSLDGTRLATTSANDFFVNVWDVAARRRVLGPLRHSHGILALAWEPDGRHLATGGMDQTIKVWDMATGQETATLRGHLDAVTSLAWGPDGRLASAGDHGSLKMWDPVHDQDVLVLPGDGRRATALAWSPDGGRLAWAADDGAVRVWDAAAHKETLSFHAHDERRLHPQFGLVQAVAWSPDGTRLASAGTDGAARVWDAATGRLVFTLPTDHGAVWCLAWNPAGNRLAAGAQDGTIQMAEGLGGTPTVRAFPAHESPALVDAQRAGVHALAWNPRGDRLASTGWNDKLVKLWKPGRGTEVGRIAGHARSVLGVSWSPDGQTLALAGADFLVETWDVRTLRPLQTMRGHSDFAKAVSWNPDGSRLASAGFDGSVRVWDPRTGEETLALRGGFAMFYDVAWSPDGARLAAAGSDGRVRVWDATGGFSPTPTEASP